MGCKARSLCRSGVRLDRSATRTCDHERAPVRPGVSGCFCHRCPKGFRDFVPSVFGAGFEPKDRCGRGALAGGSRADSPATPAPGPPGALRVSFAALEALFQGRDLSLRVRLILLALAVFLPALVAALWVISRAYDSERAGLERGLRETTRALSMVIDRELSQRETVARFLADSTASRRRAEPDRIGPARLLRAGAARHRRARRVGRAVDADRSDPQHAAAVRRGAAAGRRRTVRRLSVRHRPSRC